MSRPVEPSCRVLTSSTAVRALLLTALALSFAACGSKAGTSGSGVDVGTVGDDTIIGDDADAGGNDVVGADADAAGKDTDVAGKDADAQVAKDSDVAVDKEVDAAVDDAADVTEDVADASDDASDVNQPDIVLCTQAACDDKDPCTDDKCEPAVGCSHTNNTAPCEDGDPCTINDACQAGACTTGAAVDCSDANPCTDDSCDATGTCKHANNTVGCDDGDVCTGGDTCANGDCAPGSLSGCDDGNACTTDSCTAGTGCVHDNLDGACDDGNACTPNDACSAGTCIGTGALPCDDGNLCTADGCTASAGCVHSDLDGNACDDGQSCSGPDACLHGICQGPASNCVDNNACTDDTCSDANGCVYLPNKVTCDDGDACTVGDACKDSACGAGAIKTCDDKNPCTIDKCGTDGVCSNTATSDVCDDGDACTTDDVCTQNVCAGVALKCDDGLVCTADSCDPKTGCVVKLLTGGCADGDACTGNDTCNNGQCIPGDPVNCDDGNACTTDLCDKTGGCKHALATGSCEDGNACTLGDTCVDTQCVAGTDALACDDKNGCTKDACVASTGCVFTNDNGAACDDGQTCSTNDACLNGNCVGSVAGCADTNPCTDDTCKDGVGCVHLANTIACDDGTACTTNDVCGASTCGGTSLTCDDANPCTTDSCDSVKGCLFAAQSTGDCTDGDACTTGEHCDNGTCVKSATDCDDKEACTADSCDSKSGCKHASILANCNDGDACTTGDACDAGKCVGAGALICDDKNVCTSDSCDKINGCQFAENTLACDDNDACTTVDTCVASKCVGASALACDDKNACTSDSCDAAKGCQYTNLDGKACDDNQVCSSNDTCQAGVCAGTALNCADTNGCTTDTCADGVGCVHLANAATCDDGDACTTSDTCVDKACKGGAAPSCDDNNACTADACDKTTGCFTIKLTTACDDGDACTSGDVCGGGKCAPTGVTNCDDKNPCTTDSCDSKLGCVNTATSGASCDDKNACTNGDTCDGALCKGATISCGDANPCTIDGCNVLTGCTNVAGNDGTTCTDGNACTDGDACANGTCSGTTITCNDQNPCTTDSCNPAKGCVFANNSNSCNDGVACTTNDVCGGGSCAGTTNDALCDDNFPCTIDTCDAKSDCGHVAGNDAASCNDGEVCTLVDHCSGGKCVGALDACQDGNPCTNDSCVLGQGCKHVNNTFTCDDGNACTTVDTCTGGECVGAQPVTCVALDQCHSVGTCDTATGKCSDPALSDGTSCSDSNACTLSDTCVGGVCKSGTDKTCTAQDQCHVAGTCDTTTGTCSNPTQNDGFGCDDNKPCTLTDTCTGGVCAGIDGSGQVCDTGKQGVCAPGVTKCGGNGLYCEQNVQPSNETCDGIDNDCDGTTDNGDPSGGNTCNTGLLGPCSVGVTHCQQGAVACTQTTQPASEVCNGVDDNCNGVTDEGVKTTFYADTDNDGYGDPNATVLACSVPAGYVANNTDCNDKVSSTHPTALEQCNGVDDNCDGSTDETYNVGTACGVGACAGGTWTCKIDHTGTFCPTATQAKTEICNGIDDNCDGVTDEGNPGGGVNCNSGKPGVCAPGTTACVTGEVVCQQNVQPSAETCNGLDDNCDGSVDEGVKTTFYADTDSDGYGDPNNTTQACTVPAGFLANKTDCNDSAASIHPNATESCNGIDDNCSGTTDETFDVGTSCGTGQCAGGSKICTADHTGTYCPSMSNAANEVCNGLDDNCDGTTDEGNPGGGISCNSGKPGICGPGTTVCLTGAVACLQNLQPTNEVCNGIDDNCDGAVDEGVKTTYYADTDNDGYGDPNAAVQACTVPAGYVANSTDCNDTVAAIHPTAVETCNGVDDNCSGTTDEGFNVGAACGTGACAGGKYVCSADHASSTCDSASKATTEVCDGIDNNCNGTTDEGNPGAGAACNTGLAGVCAPGTTVCSGGAVECVQNVQPSAEVCDGIDNNCNGAVDDGNPGGGLACSTGNAGVCNAGTTVCSNGAIGCTQNVQPSAEVCDGLDNNCNGTVDDGNPGSGAACSTGKAGACASGTTTCLAGGLTCSQTNQPSAEVCDNVDNNCNGVVDEGNPGGGLSCGTGLSGVCSAGTTACNAGAVVCNQNVQASAETCDGLDNNCNGAVDDGNPGGGANCSTGKFGVCSAGTTACSAGSLACNQNVQPSSEVCDGLDNNCNGVQDEGNPGGGVSCNTGLYGPCSAGTTACVSGAVACNQNVKAATEACNNVDDDCNGLTDDMGTTSCGTGTCQKTVQNCIAGVTQTCTLANGNVCNDSNACTISDQCANGVCVGTNANCNDSIACTTDSCDPVLGCVHTAVASSCNDNIACTADTCSVSTGCVYTPDNTKCTDNTSCTADTCSAVSGCVFTPDNTKCSDGNLCTTDTCTSGASTTGCTNPIVGNGLACANGTPCKTSASQCVNGACHYVANTCNDGNACTADSCDATTGNCVNTTYAVCPVCGNGTIEGPEVCDDGNTTIGDGCSAICRVEAPYVCTGTPSVCTSSVEINCGDGKDNDGDTKSDCADTDCALACNTSFGGVCGTSEVRVEYSVVPATPIAIPDNNLTGITANIAVGTAGSIKRFVTQTNIAHTYDSDLTMTVKSPVGVSVIADSAQGASGVNFTDTIFAQTCATVLPSSATNAPFTACYLPLNSYAVFTNAASLGTWSWNVYDNSAQDTGTLINWRLAMCIAPVAAPTCGNGYVDVGEACDDGNAVNGDGCDNNCTITECGNGILTSGEICDDGNYVENDGCDSNCTITGCSNGVTTAEETCANTNFNTLNADGCSSACNTESTYTEVDPNTTTANADTNATAATPLELTAKSSIISGTFSATSDVDYYRLKLASAAVVRFELFDSSGNDCTSTNIGTATKLTLYDSGGVVITSDTPGTGFGPMGIGQCSALSYALNAGTYYVQAKKTTSVATAQAYKLQMAIEYAKGAEVEPNDTIATATPMPGEDIVFTGDHSLATDTDYFKIFVPPGKSLRAELIEGAPATETCESLGIDSILTLYDSTGASVGSANDGGRGYCSIIDGTGTATAVTAGARGLNGLYYYLKVTSNSTTATNANQFLYRVIVTIR